MAKIRRYDEIMSEAVANFVAQQDKITDLNEGSVIHTILDTVSRIAEREYVAIRQGYNEMLSIIPYSPFEFVRKEGMFASGNVIFFRDKAINARTILPKGLHVEGGGLKFTTTEMGVIEAGALESQEVSVIADGAGRDWNIGADVINTIDSVVAMDVAGVKNNKAFTGGSDEETNGDYEERFRAYLAGLSGTNCYAIRAAALSVKTVRSVSTENHKPPLKNIYNMSVYVEDGSGGATDETLDAVRLAIEGDGSSENQGHLAPGVNVRILSPTAVPVNIAMSVTVVNADSASSQEEVESAVRGYVNGLLIGRSFLLSDCMAKVKALPYVKDVSISSPIKNINVDIDQIVRLNNIDISVAEEE